MPSLPDALRKKGLPMTAACYENGKSDHEVFCQLIEESGGVVPAIFGAVEINLAGFNIQKGIFIYRPET